MTFEEEKEHVKREHRRVWDWLLDADTLDITRPLFDDNDEMYFSQAERRKHDAGIPQRGPRA